MPPIIDGMEAQELMDMDGLPMPGMPAPMPMPGIMAGGQLRYERTPQMYALMGTLPNCAPALT